ECASQADQLGRQVVALHCHAPAVNPKIERDVLDAGELAEPPDLFDLGPQEGGRLLDLPWELLEIGVAGGHMDAGPFVPPAVRLAGRKPRLPAPFHGAEGQRATGEETVHVEVRAVSTQHRRHSLPSASRNDRAYLPGRPESPYTTESGDAGPLRCR